MPRPTTSTSSASSISETWNSGRVPVPPRPTPGQQEALARAFGCPRAVYNYVIHTREQDRREGGVVSEGRGPVEAAEQPRGRAVGPLLRGGIVLALVRSENTEMLW
ncbi:helix-turn-helix domain-containing protein [Nocardia sp. SSK8]|uniref:helix-turn-helix domain-containing protein n=1 Tax=Nocardia sp. SSK8 TaxID=3120154 RepID=UPI003FA53520